MLPKELKLILPIYKNKLFIYDWENFTKRINDELIRSIMEESQFFYVEINFTIVERELPRSSSRAEFWEAFLDLLLMQKRACDICGFLNNDEGIAFIFVDSTLNTKESNPVWNRFCKGVEAKTFSDMRKWEGIIYAQYPPEEFLNK